MKQASEQVAKLVYSSQKEGYYWQQNDTVSRLFATKAQAQRAMLSGNVVFKQRPLSTY